MRLLLVLVCFVAIGCESKNEPKAEGAAKVPEAKIAEKKAPLNTQAKNKLEITPQKKYALKLTQEARGKKLNPDLSVGWANIGSVLPKSLDGLRRIELPGKAKSSDEVHIAYIGVGRAINVRLKKVPGPSPLSVKPGELLKDDAAKTEKKGLEIDGVQIARTFTDGESKKSEAKAVFSNKLEVRLEVQPAKSPDESVDLLKKLGIDVFKNRADAM